MICLSDIAPRRTFVRRGVLLWIVGPGCLLMLLGCGPDLSQKTTPATPPGRTSTTSNAQQPGGTPTDQQAPREGSRDELLPATKKPVPPTVIPRFTDIAGEKGIDFTQFSDTVPGRFFLPEVMGSGAAWGDFDLDGVLDLFLADGCPLDSTAKPQPQHHARLYYGRAQGGFREVSELAHADLVGYGQGCAVGDYDVDGFPDLYLANYGPNRLLHNNGDGTFTDVTAEAGVGDPRWSSSAAWFDIDADGDLDLYVVNYMDVTFQTHKVCQFDGLDAYCGPGSHTATPDAVYINDGQGRFHDGLEELGFTAEDGKGLAITATDLDDDRVAEIYIANDMTSNFLFTRGPTSPQGPLERRYREIATTAGCATSGTGMNEASMGVACADFDNDGRLDLFLTHYYHAKNTLYRNLGNLLFDDDSRRTRIAAISRESLGFGNSAFDFDRDGDVDLFIANGHVLGPLHPPYAMQPQLLANEGGLFADISQYAGPYFSEKWLGRSVASADIDDDGDLDLVVTHLERPVVLLRNDTVTKRDWLGFELRTRSRIPAVGGMVIVQRGSLKMRQPISAGGSYLASSDSRLAFGLGTATGPVDVEIRWPSGRTDHHQFVDLNRYVRLISPDD